MYRVALILFGIILLILNQTGQLISFNFQFTLFIAGIVLLGIPHGAADLLVAIQNRQHQKSVFSRIHFFSGYLGRMIGFGLLLYFFPVVGILLFIIFSAYHFGETDLHFFKTNNFWGKLLVVSYGLVILSVILLHDPEELLQIITIGGFEEGNFLFIQQLINYRVAILSFSLLFFFSSVFLYFLLAKEKEKIEDQFLWQFAILIIILYNIPLLLGFTFYFVIWHSLLSIRNIFSYLSVNREMTYPFIARQIVFYSLLALVGIALFIFTGYLDFSSRAVVIYILFGLAVLTAPHMNIMHEMYNRLRKSK